MHEDGASSCPGGVKAGQAANTQAAAACSYHLLRGSLSFCLHAPAKSGVEPHTLAPTCYQCQVWCTLPGRMHPRAHQPPLGGAGVVALDGVHVLLQVVPACQVDTATSHGAARAHALELCGRRLQAPRIVTARCFLCGARACGLGDGHRVQQLAPCCAEAGAGLMHPLHQPCSGLNRSMRGSRPLTDQLALTGLASVEGHESATQHRSCRCLRLQSPAGCMHTWPSMLMLRPAQPHEAQPVKQAGPQRPLPQ